MRIRMRMPSQSAAGSMAILLFSISCSDALGPRRDNAVSPHRVMGSGLSLSLVGANIVRHKPIPGEVQTSRFVLQGERTARGSCRFHREIKFKDGDKILSEWVIESDPETCTDVLAQGHLPPRRALSQPNQKPASGKSPAVTPSFFQTGANYYQGEQNAGSLAGAHITVEWRWQGWFTALANIDDVQFHYTVSPNCINGASGYVAWAWAGNDTFTTLPRPADAYFWGGGGSPYNACSYMYLQHNQAFSLGYNTDDCQFYNTFTPNLNTNSTLFFDVNGVLWRSYGFTYDNDFQYCGTAQQDFQAVLDAENPPTGMVNAASPLTIGAIP